MNNRRSGQWRSKPLPRNWASLRAQCFRRDHYQCVVVLSDGSPCPGKDLECDHIVEGGPDSLDNLQTLCKFHHSVKTHEYNRRVWKARMREVKSRFNRVDQHPGRVGW